MTPVPVLHRASPVADGQGWVQADADIAELRGRWIRLIYAYPTLQPLIRPVLRIAVADTLLPVQDQILKAPTRGEAEWFGFIPDTAQQLSIGPPGDAATSIRILHLEVLSPFGLARLLARRQPGSTFLSAVTFLIGRREEARQIMREALLAPFDDAGRRRDRGDRGSRAEINPMAVLDTQPFEHQPTGPHPKEPHPKEPRPQFTFLIDAKDGVLPLVWEQFEEAQQASGHRIRCLAWDNRGLEQNALLSAALAEPPEADDPLEMARSPGDMTASASSLGNRWIVCLSEDEQIHPDFLTVASAVLTAHPAAIAFFGDLWRLSPAPGPGDQSSVTFEAPAAGGQAPVRGQNQSAELLLNPDWSPFFFRNRQEGFPTLFVRSDIARPALMSPSALHPRIRLEEALSDEPRERIVHCHRPLTARRVDPGREQARFQPAMPHVGASPATLASIIIPTRDRLDLIRPCIESLVARTSNARFEIILVDNGSKDPKVLTLMDEWVRAGTIRLLNRPGGFNFSFLCNEGAAAAKGDVLVFLNNDTAVKSADWLARLVPLALNPRLGAVGPRLLYKDGTIQHEGVVIGLGGLAGHLYRTMPPLAAPDRPALFPGFGVEREVAAVTGACLAVERRKFQAIGGFNAIDLPVDLNDVDLCLRLVERGWNSFIVPGIELYHYESQSRGISGKPFSTYRKERSYFRQRWGQFIRHDPFFHPALSLYAMKPQMD